MKDVERLEIEDKEVLREFAQMSVLDRMVRKWRQGELLSAARRLGTRKVLQYLHRLKSDLPYQLDDERVMTKRFSETFSVLGPHHKPYANYYLDTRFPLDANSVVYSLGVGGDVGFDRAVAQAFGCKVQLYDPTPDSISAVELMRIRQPDDAVMKLLEFHPVGAWSEDTTLRFTMPERGGGNASAVVDGGKNSKYFDAPCETVATMMRKNGHTRIDVLKMDIEGAAEPVLESVLEAKIYPDQLLVEFERPRRDVQKVIRYFAHVDVLCARMSALGYEIIHLPRERAKYFALELLFARTAKPA